MTRNKSSRILALLLVMVMMFGVFSPAAQARGIGGSVEVNVHSINYTITTKYVDKTGNSIQADNPAALTGAGQTYTATPDTISGFVYKGFYVDGVGSLTNLTTGDLTVTTKSDGSDSANGQGYYTLYAVYGKDENDNKIDDDDENYKITEYFTDESGTVLQAANTVYVNGGVHYNGTPPTIPGYLYKGYYFAGTMAGENDTHTSGSLANPLSGNPYILLQSKTLGVTATYDVTMVYENDPSQYATVTFDANGGQGTMTPQTVLKNAATQLDANTFTMPGYTFDGWSLTSGGGAVYADGASITVSADTTLYAVWKYDSSQWATITFDANGGQGTMATQTVLKNTATQLNANTFTMLGYTFDGWSLTSGGGAVYADGASITVSADTTLYAAWEFDSSQWATITFDGNGAGAGNMAPITVLKGNQVTLTGNAFVYDPSNPQWDLFSGWSTDASKTALADKVYNDKQVITANDNMTLYAIWGTPDLAGSMTANSSDFQVGDVVNYELYVYNQATSNSVTMYNGYIELTIPTNSATLNEMSLRATSPDGSQKYMMVYDYNEATGVLKIYLNDFDPGEGYKITFSVVTKVDGPFLVYWELDGSGVYPTTTRSLISAAAFSLSNGNGRGIGGSVSVNVK